MLISLGSDPDHKFFLVLDPDPGFFFEGRIRIYLFLGAESATPGKGQRSGDHTPL